LSEISYYWIMLLTCINAAELYLPGVDRRYLEEVLQHPVLDPAGEENDGYWDGSKYYRFRQAHTDEDGDDLLARIEIQTPDEAFYFYTLDSEKYVSRHYQALGGVRTLFREVQTIYIEGDSRRHRE